MAKIIFSKLIVGTFIATVGCSNDYVEIKIERDGESRIIHTTNIENDYNTDERYRKLVLSFLDNKAYFEQDYVENARDLSLREIFIAIPIKTDRELWHYNSDMNMSRLSLAADLHDCDDPTLRGFMETLLRKNVQPDGFYHYDFVSYVVALMPRHLDKPLLSIPPRDICFTVNQGVPNDFFSHTDYRSNEIRISASELSGLLTTIGLTASPW